MLRDGITGDWYFARFFLSQLGTDLYLGLELSLDTKGLCGHQGCQQTPGLRRLDRQISQR